MSTPFAYNTVTTDGAALIAQATAANPIVIVGAKSCTLAASDNTDLASKPLSWYDGKSGTIAAVSATNAVARIVAKYTNSGTAQTVKSFCITARLASQSDAQAVVLTAKSDPDAAVFLPGADDVSMIVNILHSIAINSSGTVEVTPGASASVEDLERFVSIHKAGDPTTGEAQTILGQKTFKGALKVGTVQDNGSDAGHQITLAGGKATLGSPMFALIGFDSSQNINNVRVGDMISTWDFTGTVLYNTHASSQIGKDDAKIKNIYTENLNASNVNGVLPSFSSGNVQIGAILLIRVVMGANVALYAGLDIVNGQSQVISGTTVTPQIMVAAIELGSAKVFLGDGQTAIGNDTKWRLMSTAFCTSFIDSGTTKYEGVALAMRIE